MSPREVNLALIRLCLLTPADLHCDIREKDILANLNA